MREISIYGYLVPDSPLFPLFPDGIAPLRWAKASPLGKQWVFTVDIDKLTTEQTSLMINIYCSQYPEEPRDRVLSLFRHGLTVPDDHFKETFMYGRTLTRETWRNL